MPLIWDGEPVDVFTRGFARYDATIQRALRGICDVFVPLIEAWMKQNAPWVDRTSNARQGLYAMADDLVMGAYVAFGHGVDYGTWLEVKRSGYWGILLKAYDHFAPLIWAAVEKLFE